MNILEPPNQTRSELNAKRVNNTSRTITIGGYTFGSEGVTDILTDLRHWCHFHDIQFEKCLRTSENHFLQERSP